MKTKQEIQDAIDLFKEMIADESNPKEEREIYESSLSEYEKMLKDFKEPKVEPKKEVKKVEKKPTPVKIDKSKNPYKVDILLDKQSFGKDFDLVKMSDTLFLLQPKNEKYSEFEIEKKGGKWHVTCVTKIKKEFTTPQGAFNYVGKTIYKGKLKEMITKEKKKKDKQKEWEEKHPDGLTVGQSLKKEAKEIGSKTEKNPLNKKDKAPAISGIEKIVEAVKEGMAKESDGKSFIRGLITALQKML